jgi:hypothetical protein
MQTWIKRFIFISLAVVACSFVFLSFAAQARLSKESKLVINGIDGIRVGMTIAQAEQAAKIVLVEKGSGRAGLGGCYYVEPQSNPLDIGFMVISDREDERVLKERDRIMRVDVYQDSAIATLSGAKIGDSEARIKSLYKGRIRVTPHPYTGDRGGHYLTYTPKDASDRNYRLIFETLNKRVTQFRSGQLPEVDYSQLPNTERSTAERVS